MRPYLLLAVLVFAGCADDSVGPDTAYRRLIDSFDSFDQCIAEGSPSTPCYQTLTLCHNQLVLMDLDNHQQEGKFTLENEAAVAKFPTTTVIFDLQTASSTQLPGRHPWELVEPTFYGCDNPE